MNDPAQRTDEEKISIKNAEELRQVLRQAELAVTNLRGRGPENVLQLLLSIDAIETNIPILSQQGVDLKPEKTRLETLENMLTSRAKQLVSECGKEALVRWREEQRPPESSWWWYIDQHLAAKRAAAIRRWSIRGLIVAGVLLVVVVVFQVFFAPSAGESALARNISDGESHMLSGDLKGAQAEYEKALAIDPNNGEAYLNLAAIFEQLNDPVKAQEYYAKAQTLITEPVQYHAALALIYYRMSMGGQDTLAKGEAEANVAIATDDKSAIAHFAMGNIYEAQNRMSEAIDQFELASSYSNQPSLTVLARMRMGMLMQRPAVGATPEEGTPEATTVK